MRILLIKTSSMGDIIHTFPALTDAGLAFSNQISFDWVVEEAFADIPRWHPLVNKVVPYALRKWRKDIFSRQTLGEWKRFRKTLHEENYDLILDAQGLVKSAFLTFLVKGVRVGLDGGSAREALASLAYQRKCTVNFYQHAVVRMRSLFAQGLEYALPDNAPDFGLNRQQFSLASGYAAAEKYLVFLHGTTWATKQWPDAYWVQLAKLAIASGYRVKMSASHPDEIERARRIVKESAVDIIPNLGISDMAHLLVNASAVVSVDTGLGHLAAALNVPTVSLYGPTNPAFTGALGKKSIHLAAHFSCAPCLGRLCTYPNQGEVTPACYATIKPARVWEAVLSLL